MPYLEYGHQSRSLGPGVLLIGSGSEAGWRIRDRDLAHLHAMIMTERDGRVTVNRASPDLLVAVNGEPLGDGARTLQFGDQIGVGSVEFTFVESAHPTADTGEGYLYDARRNKLYTLGEVMKIGRDITSDMVLQEPEVARRHAVVRWNGGNFIISPFAGAATLVNGERILAATTLNDGDVVSVGRTTLRFSTIVPPSSALEDGLRHRTSKQVAPLPSMFSGEFESRRRIKRTARRRAGRVAVVALATGALIAGLVTAYERSMASPRRGADSSSTTVTSSSVPR
jgi:predicted component of type VI protein secretion system